MADLINIPKAPDVTGPTGSTDDLNKTIESLAVTLIADRSMDRVKEQWEEDRKKDPL